MAVAVVAEGRCDGVADLPDGSDWVKWNAGELTAAVKYLVERIE